MKIADCGLRIVARTRYQPGAVAPIRIVMLLLLVLSASPLAAQAEPKPPANPAEARLEALEKELRELRARLDQGDAKDRDTALREKALIQVYGDIGLRYHGLFESQTETTNRPEFRLHLGALAPPTKRAASASATTCA